MIKSPSCIPNISVRDRKGETTTMDLDAFINQVVDEIKTRKNNG